MSSGMSHLSEINFQPEKKILGWGWDQTRGYRCESNMSQSLHNGGLLKITSSVFYCKLDGSFSSTCSIQALNFLKFQDKISLETNSWALDSRTFLVPKLRGLYFKQLFFKEFSGQFSLCYTLILWAIDVTLKKPDEINFIFK